MHIPPLSRWFFCSLTLALIGSTVSAEPISFRQDLARIFLQRCVGCHGPQKAEGNYRVDTFKHLLQAGDSELVPFTAGDLSESETFRRLTSDDTDERMPLDADPLPADQIAAIKQWIIEGAKFDGPDADAALATILPPPVHPDPPAVYPATLPITALAFSANGNELFVGGYHEITVWNPADGTLLRRIKNVGQRTYALCFSPDGKLLAAAGGAPGSLGEVRLYDPTNGQLINVLGTTTDVILDAAFSPDGKLLAMAGADNMIRIANVETAEKQHEIASHSDWVSAVAWNRDGTKIATGSRDKTAKVFDAKTGELLITYSGHSDAVNGVAFHDSGEEVFSASADRKIHQWKVADGKKSADVASLGGEAYRLELVDGFLFVPSADKTARQIEMASKKQVHSFGGHADWVLSTAYCNAAQRAATGTLDGRVHIWNTSDGQQVTTFVAAPGRDSN